MAEIAGVKKNTVSTWERDTRRPDQRALKKLAEYFGVSWEYLLGEGSDTQTSLTVQNEVVDASPDDRLRDGLLQLTEKHVLQTVILLSHRV